MVKKPISRYCSFKQKVTNSKFKEETQQAILHWKNMHLFTPVFINTDLAIFNM
jgi:hypothetical protein